MKLRPKNTPRKTPILVFSKRWPFNTFVFTAENDKDEPRETCHMKDIIVSGLSRTAHHQTVFVPVLYYMSSCGRKSNIWTVIVCLSKPRTATRKTHLTDVMKTLRGDWMTNNILTTNARKGFLHFLNE